jgi:hypothetical protein
MRVQDLLLTALFLEGIAEALVAIRRHLHAFEGTAESDSSVLEDAVYRRTGSVAVPQPVALTADQALRGDHDAEPIQIDGQVLNKFRDFGHFGLEWNVATSRASTDDCDY